MVEKKFIKLGAVAVAVVALVIGLSVGITQSKKNNVSAASNAIDSDTLDSEYDFDEYCSTSSKSGKSGGSKSGKSGGDSYSYYYSSSSSDDKDTSNAGGRRGLVVPGTEDYELEMVNPAQRRKLREELNRSEFRMQTQP